MSYFNYAWEWLTSSQNWHGSDGKPSLQKVGKAIKALSGLAAEPVNKNLCDAN